MPVGSHKDAFKAHQLVKKLIQKDQKSELAQIAATILLDFVKNQRQVSSDFAPEALPVHDTGYPEPKLDKALVAVEKLCGKCEESHDNNCFVNQARRVLIAARTGIDLGTAFDGQKGLEELLQEAEAMRAERESQQPTAECPDGRGADTTTASPAAQADNAPAAGNDSAADAAALAELEQLREKDVFRATLIDEVVSTIKSVSEGDYAAEMEVHDDEQLGKLATTFNLMLRTINETMARLDQLVAERNAELKQIMKTVPVGLLSIDARRRVGPEYSREAVAILGTADLRGRDFLDLLGLTRKREADRAKLEDYLDLFALGTLPDKDLAPLNPFPEIEIEEELSAAAAEAIQTDTSLIQRRAGSRWLRTKFYALAAEDAPGSVLVELEDITREKKLAAEVEAGQRRNDQLRAIAEDPDLFRDFLAETQRILERCAPALAGLTPGALDPAVINEVFRGVHTIKGAAGSFALHGVGERAGALEDRLGALRDGEAARFDGAAKDDLRTAFIALEAEVAAAREAARPFLGEEEGAEGVSLRVPLAALEALERDLVTGQVEDATTRARALQRIPAARALAKTRKIVHGLIERLGKPVTFAFQGDREPVHAAAAASLNMALVHLVRNAFDHGVESPEARAQAGKPEAGAVSLRVERGEDGALTVSVVDDGKGLDPSALRASAVKKGLLTEAEAEALSDDEARRLIFRPGFSTAASVTDVSGRGVGMDAVLTAVTEELAGAIEIDSTPGQGTTFRLRAPKA